MHYLGVYSYDYHCGHQGFFSQNFLNGISSPVYYISRSVN